MLNSQISTTPQQMHSADWALQREEAALSQASDLIKAKEFQKARAIYEGLIDSGSVNPRAYSNLAILLGLDGSLHEKLRLMHQAVILAASDPCYVNNLGITYFELEQQQAAAACFEAAIRSSPLDMAGYLNLARLYSKIGDLETEIERRQTSTPNPADDVRHSLILACLELQRGHTDAAIPWLKQAVRLKPSSFELLLLTGNALVDAGRVAEAIECLYEAFALQPDSASVYASLANAFHELGDADAAMKHFKQALKIAPKDPGISFRLAGLYAEVGMHDEAIAIYEKALALKNAADDPGLLGNLASSLNAVGDRARALNILRDLYEKDPTQLPLFYGTMFNDALTAKPDHAAILSKAKAFWRQFDQSNSAVDAAQDSSLGAYRWESTSKTRIGFLSGDFGAHVVSQFLLSFLLNYDKSRFEVELIATKRRYDDIAVQMAEAVDEVISVQGLSDAAARARIRSRGYQIIVELSGYTSATGIHLLAERCAPVQCHYIGYHATTGLDTIDYFIGDDELTPPEFAHQFSEELIRLQGPWIAQTTLEPYIQAAPHFETQDPVLGCFGQITKMGTETLNYWCAAMKELPNSVLVIKDRGVNNQSFQNRVREFMGSREIGAQRIRFLGPTPGWQDHLSCYNCIDIALDTTPWSSATTAFDAIRMGVPLVAIRGETTPSRMSSSIVKHLGKSEWAARDPIQFAAIVKDLCADLTQLRAGKTARQQQAFSSPLCDTESLARNLEKALMDMLRKKGQPGES